MATLRDRNAQEAAAGMPVPAGMRGISLTAKAYYDLKYRLHQKLLDRVDLTVIDSLPPDQLRSELRLLTERLLTEEGAAINEIERRRIVQDIQNEVLGFGPLEPLLADPGISDILVNAHDVIFIERNGRLERTPIRFNNDAHLLKIIDKIVSRVGRRIDESSPMVDARLPDGSRVNAIIPPLALDGPTLSIRRFNRSGFKLADLVNVKALTPEMAQIAVGLVRAKLNILISGGTGAGKTTLLNALSAGIPETDRIITIEDAAELQLQQPHVIRLETRPPNIEGKGEITQRALLRNTLRMRPDRIIVGEVRGAEVVDMLQAMNTGHDGSMTTIHANTPRDALIRIENMFSMSGMQIPAKALRQQIASAIHVVVQASRLVDGRRKVTSIQEVVGTEGEMISMQEIFQFEQTGIDADGTVKGRFRATGIRPKFAARLRSFGIELPDTLFNPGRVYE